MRKKLYLFMVIVTALALISGCSEEKGKSEGVVLAKVGKTEIVQEEFLKEVSRMPEWAQAQFTGKEGKEKLLEGLVRNELLYQNAKKMGLNKDKEYVAQMKDIEKKLLVELSLKKEIEEKTKVDDAEVKDFYNKNADKFTIGTKIRASHILVETEDQAKKIYDRIKRGESFAKLAEANSRDKGSAANGGDLGYFGRGQMVPEFEQALVQLKPGQVSEPVKSRFGYHIIQLVDIEKGEVASLEQSKEAIKRQLAGEKQKKLVETLIENLKKDIKITQNTNLLETITLPWEKPETKK